MLCLAPLRRSGDLTRSVGRWLLADGTNNAILMLDFTEEGLRRAEEEDEEEDDDDDDGGLGAYL